MNEGDAAGAAGRRIDELLEQFERAGDVEAHRRAEELVRTIIEFYGLGLGRIVEFLRDSESGEALLRRCAADSLVASLLSLHDLHPDSTEQRVTEALDTVRPYLGSHAGDVDLVGIDGDGVVHLRLRGNCDGCPSSTVTVKLAIESAIRQAAPELAGIEVEGVVTSEVETGAGPGGRPLLPLVPEQAPAPEPVDAWVTLRGLEGLAQGQVVRTHVDREPVLVCNVDGDLYAYVDHCPNCSGAIAEGALTEGLLRCPQCSEQYEVRLAGRGAQRSELHLTPLPLLADSGSVRVAFAVGAAS
jgi:Fe-S cluster biogenesis protein NfuA/nitrite reductase/ring-hydroxylating ferredoxin subunit